MKTSFAVASASLALLGGALTGVRAEEIFEPIAPPSASAPCRFVGETCLRFQGYVVVGHGGRLDAEPFASGSRSADVAINPDASLGADRLYLRTGSNELR